MSDLATLIAQLSGGNQPPAADPAAAAVRLARASIDVLMQRLGQTIDARVVGQLAAGLTQLSAGKESFVLKLATPIPTGAAVTIKVASTQQGAPSITVTLPAAAPHAAPLQVPAQIAPLIPRAPQPASAAPFVSPPQPQATQLPLPAPAAQTAAPATIPTPQAPLPDARGPVATIAQPRLVGSQPASVVPTPGPVIPQQASPVPAVPLVPNGASPSVAPMPAPQIPAAPGQPASQVPLPVAAQPVPTPLQRTVVTSGVLPSATPAAPPAAVAPPPLVPAVAPAAVSSAQPAAAASQPAVPTAPIVEAAAPPSAVPRPAPILSTPLLGQPAQPLPSHPSPYPVRVPQAATPVVARQLPLPGADPTVSRPAAPALNLANPAQAAARQDTSAPLLARLAALVAAVAPSLPRPVIEAAGRLLASRIDLNRGGPEARTLEAAVQNAGVLASVTRDAPSDIRSGLLALRSALLTVLGTDHAAPLPPAERPAPPIKGEPPRAPGPQPVVVPDPAADGHATARALLGHTDAALSRLKLLQTASQPADVRIDAPAPRNELRLEIPVLLGSETGILQLVVERDGKHKRDAERQRGWRMRFAMNFSQTGEVGADITMLGHTASVAIWAADPDIADALDEMLPELAPAIQQHGLELTSLRVRHNAPQPARPAPGQLLDNAR